MTRRDPRLKATQCRGPHCGAPIAFVGTVNLDLMPIDLEPNPDGNVELTDDLVIFDATFPAAIVHPAGQGDLLGTGVRYMPHHATCPDADHFRYKRPARP